MNRTRIIMLLVLFALAMFLRVYRIEERTEFLGDQGVTALELQHAYETRTIPLVGLLASTGFYQGPFYFYLLAPVFLLSGGDAVATASFLAILGALTVMIIWYSGTFIFRNFWIAFAIALLYAVSPTVIQQNRTIWNPTAIPFFSSLLLVCIIKVLTTSNYRWWIVVGVVLGMLIQFHYSTYFFLPFTFLIWLYALIRKTKRNDRKAFFVSTIFAGTGFITVLAPFIVYQIRTGFVDMLNFLAYIVVPSSETTTSFSVTKHLLEPLTRLFSLYIPITGLALTLITAGTIMVFALLRKRTFWHVFFLLWLAGGIAATGFSKGGIHLHYIAFLFLPPLFFVGLALQNVEKYVNYKIVAVVILLVTMVQLRSVDIFAEGYQDIPRIRSVISFIQQDHMNQPFSFALLSSRSFSDPHYQFFFKKSMLHVEPFESQIASRLYIICEKEPCPQVDILKNQKEVTVLCNQFHCPKGFPTLSLSTWQFEKDTIVNTATIYTFRTNRRE